MADPVSTFNEENLIQVVTDLFLGGTDTTATTLHWALIHLVHHRAVQGRVPSVVPRFMPPSLCSVAVVGGSCSHLCGTGTLTDLSQT